MADGGQSPGSSQDAGRENQDPEIRALMDPAALEERLVEARARRARILSERAGGAVAERPAPPQDLPPDAVRPLVPEGVSGFAGRTARRKQDATKTADASAPLRPGAEPLGREPDTPTQVLTLVHPRQSRPQLDPSLVGASDAVVAPTAPAGVPRRRSGALLLGLAALAVGAVIGLAGAALVPGLGGWQIVIVRSAGDGQLETATSTRHAAGESEVGAATVLAEAPPAFGRLATTRTAATPGRGAFPPPLSAAPPEPPADAVVRPGLEPPPERAEAGLLRIDDPGAPPQMAMLTMRSPAVPGLMSLSPELAAAPSQETAAAAAMPELPRPNARARGGIPDVDEPGAPPRMRVPMTAESRLAESPLGGMPAGTPTLAATDPAWQLAALEVPAMRRQDRALATVPASPSRPAVSEAGLSPRVLGASIVLHHPPDAKDSAAAAERALALAGAENVVMREVALTISSPNVRYYHDEDRQAAVEVANVVSAALEGDDAAARDFTGYEPAPDRGLIEIWIDGSAPVAARAAAPRPDPAEAAREQLVRSIEERLRERLR